MLPYTALGLILFVSVLAPGFVWLRISETRVIRPPRSTVLEIAELAILGCAFTSATALVVVAAGRIWSPPLVNLSDWIAASDRTEYLLNGFWNVALSALLMIMLSLGAAGLTARFVHRGQPANLRPVRNVWQDIFQTNTDGKKPLLGINLTDGRIVEGYLPEYPQTDYGNQICLEAPIFHREAANRQRVPSELDIVIIPNARIADIGVMYDPLTESGPSDSAGETTSAG